MKICPHCGREFEPFSEDEWVCPQCAAEMPGPEPPAEKPSRLRMVMSSPTLLLIALNTLIYVLMVVQARALNFDAPLLLSWGANSGALTSDGQWWRLLTSTFEHGGLLHVALNMWCLYNLGWLAELLFGRANFTVLYLICGVGGSLGSILWHGDGVSVGASGAIFGVAGALIPAMLLHSNRELRVLLKRQLTSIALFVFYNLLIGAAAQGIDNAAHIGGLVSGLVLGTMFPTGADRGTQRGRLRVAAGIAVMAVICTVTALRAQQRNEGYVEVARAADAHERGDMNGAIAHAKRGTELKPDNPRAQFMLGTLLLNAHRYSEAVAPLQSTKTLRPTYGPAYVNLCVAQRELKLLPEALTNCEQGTKLSPNDAESWFNLGRVRYDLHDTTGARDALAKAVALSPEGFDENLQYALVLIADRQTKAAVPYLRKACALHPQDTGLQKLLAAVEQAQ